MLKLRGEKPVLSWSGLQNHIHRTANTGSTGRPRTQSLLDRVKRRVRLAVADCGCKDAVGNPKPCGVDLLINGYSIEPPTPGYRADPDFPLEDAVEIQREVLELALRQQEEEKSGATDRGCRGKSQAWYAA